MVIFNNNGCSSNIFGYIGSQAAGFFFNTEEEPLLRRIFKLKGTRFSLPRHSSELMMLQKILCYFNAWGCRTLRIKFSSKNKKQNKKFKNQLTKLPS